MLSLYRRVTVLAFQRALRAWPLALALFVYAAILLMARILIAPLGIVGGFILGFVMAACWSSYLELISQAVIGSKLRLDWNELKRTFGARLWDVVSVMFAFWIISMVTQPLTAGPNGDALAAIFAIAIAFFFNAVPELLYQGNERSFSLLLASARFMMANPVVWLLPNLLFAAAALAPFGGLQVQKPAELLLVFGSVFSSPLGIIARMPLWSWPLVLLGLHFVMVFRGILFAELLRGGGRARRFAAAAR